MSFSLLHNPFSFLPSSLPPSFSLFFISILYFFSFSLFLSSLSLFLAVDLNHASRQPSHSLYLAFSGGFQNQCHYGAAKGFQSSTGLSSLALDLQTCLSSNCSFGTRLIFSQLNKHFCLPEQPDICRQLYNIQYIQPKLS